ncbi:hypothetical protein [Parasedimentitalea huanghaiensis]|uniref:Uncharacterized protein n=1 Tax=Parasedimentitalea huanghaiensis TaxID=2682100 RepID=A0A6L6WDR2_9RHOB|nr:hypothetical protein [Zongyanglinia huanghaiensis]MVO16003.1 hypothetical protein [Zongyanglinia huanghaiensis]
MLKHLTLAATLGLALTPLAQAKEAPGKHVTVLGRNWVVTAVEDAPGRYRAERLNVELIPFRPPAMIGSRQAVRAFKAATGCSANIDTLVQSIDGSYSAQMICPN